MHNVQEENTLEDNYYFASQAIEFWETITQDLSLAWQNLTHSFTETLATVNVEKQIVPDYNSQELTTLVQPKAMAGCSVDISTVVVQSCVENSGVYTATIQTDILWRDAPVGENIIVSLDGGAIGTINVDNANSSGKLTFSIPADGLTNNHITATFNTTTSCNTEVYYKSPLPCPSATTCVAGSGIIGGRVFDDYNFDGTNNDYSSGVQAIKVYIYGTDVNGNSQLLDSTLTDTDGNYFFNGLTDNNDYRIEFGIPTYYEGWVAGFKGSNSSTQVQFVTAPSCSVDLGLANPLDYCADNPQLVTPCYVNGDPLVAGNAGGLDAFVAFSYEERGQWNGGGSANMPTHLAYANEVGTVWGIAYQKNTKTVFTSAFIKRHSGLGSLGTGGIYAIDYSNPSSPIVTNWLDVNTLAGVSTGTDPRVTDGVALGGDYDDPSHDVSAFDAVGKISLGDIDISADEKTLYVVNLNDRTLLAIDIATKTLTTSYAIPDPGCWNTTTNQAAPDDRRPWAVKVHKDDIYIGVTCSAESSQNRADMTGYIMKLDKTTGNFYSIIDIPLNYDRGLARQNDAAEWLPWTSTWQSISVRNDRIVYPQAILSDIEFDADGSIIAGFLDRVGHQSGFENYTTNTSSTDQYNGQVAGDILRICYDKATGVYQLENNAACFSGTPTGGAGSNEGPGGGEFYFEDNRNLHDELTIGGLAVLLGTREMAVSFADPLTANSGGIVWYDNELGVDSGRYEVFFEEQNGTLGKAAGLGDLELLCGYAPLEIGNYVWLDSNKDGIQDPGEAALSGINVTLFDSNKDSLTTVQTNNYGEYYFSVATVGLSTISPNSTYYIVVGTGGQFASNKLNNQLELTKANTGMGTMPEENDSDASIASGVDTQIDGLPYIQITTGNAGSVNHSYDIGFTCPACQEVQVTVTDSLVYGATILDSTGVDNAYQAKGAADGAFAELYDGSDEIIIDFGQTIAAGQTYDVIWRRKNSYTDADPATIIVEESSDNVSFNEHPVEPSTTEKTNFITTTLTADIDTRYLKLRQKLGSGNDFELDAILYTIENGITTIACSTGGVEITGIDFSACDVVNNTATLSALITWENSMTDNIDVLLDGSNLTTIINSSTTSPFTVTTTIPTDGSIDHQLVIAATCNDTATIKYPVPCPTLVGTCTGTAGIGGNAFDDYNYDGENNDYSGGIQGVKVKIYDCANALVDSTSTDNDGNYHFASANNGEQYRLEFDLPAALACFLCPSNAGSDNASTVQFVTAPACANIGYNDPTKYCGDNPNFFLSCFTSGPRNSVGNDAAIVQAPYNSGADVGQSGFNSPSKTVIANIGQIGTVWGIAHHRKTGKVFSSAFVRRFTDLGPGSGHPNSDGTGTIYVTDLSTALPNGTAFIDFDEIYGKGYTGLNPHPGGEGSSCAGNDATPSGLGCWTHDPDAFDKVGRIGIGDIDLSENEETLWAIAIATKELIKIPIGANATLPTADKIERFSIPIDKTLFAELSNCNGEMMPFGLKYYKGKLFIGITCRKNQGQSYSSFNQHDLGFVYSFDATAQTWKHEVSVPSFFKKDGSGNWDGWHTTHDNAMFKEAAPWLTDIEFTSEGDMVIGIRDHVGDQYGRNSPSTNTSSGNLYSHAINGHMVKACANETGGWTMESQGSCGGVVGSYVATNPWSSQSRGPGGGRFYSIRGAEDYFSQGALGQLPGSDEITLVAYDVAQVYDAGIAWLSNQNGSYKRRYQILSSNELNGNGLFGKAASLGDIEFGCGEAPLEIGNYVWDDVDKNGIQDACEVGIQGVRVVLFNASCDTVAIDTTDATGNYYFNDAKIKEYTTQTDTSLQANTSYFIVFGTASQWDNGASKLNIGAKSYDLTTANQGSNDEIDSDASVGNTSCYNNLPYIAVTTPDNGCAAHRYDVGFVEASCKLEITSIDYTNCTNTSGQNYETTLNLLLTWEASPIGESINVLLDGSSLATLSSTTNSPATITHTIPADGSINHQIIAQFTNTTTCSDTATIKYPVPCPTLVGTCTGTAGIGGNAFTDYNYDGISNDYSGGIQGVKVTLYDCANTAVDSLYTDNDGNYQFSTANNGEQYRLEFDLPEVLACDLCPSNAGSDNHSTVQFVTAPACANVGYNNPNQYCEENPPFFLSCFIAGPRTAVAADAAIVQAPYNSGADVGQSGFNSPGKTVLANIGQIGTVWGMAHHRKTGKIFTSAFVRRFTDLGPGSGHPNSDGTGTIYVTDLSAALPNGTAFIDFDEIFGKGYTGLNPHPGGEGSSCAGNDATPSGLGCWAHDPDAFDKVGRIGIGDIDLSDDEKNLWAIAIATKELIKIPIGETATLPPTAQVERFPIPIDKTLFTALSNCNGEMMPFGLKYHKGKLFIGITCRKNQGQSYSSFNQHDLGFVYSFDAAAQTWKHEVSVPSFFKKDGSGNWDGWHTTHDNAMFKEATPWLTDIEFTSEGDMVIGMRDHVGDQYGRNSPSTNTSSGNLYSHSINGHMVKACANETGGWTMESQGSCGGVVGSYVATNPWSSSSKGPGGGRFYNIRGAEDYFSQGALGQLPGSDEITLVAYDVAQVYDAGVAWLSNQDGSLKRRYQVLNSNQLNGNGLFGKAASLGDVEFGCGEAPLEIGNYVWNDLDKDGIQDACEGGIQGVRVVLFNTACDTIAIDTTNVTGNYYFNDAKVRAYTAQADTILQANTNYYIVFGTAGQWDNGSGKLTVGATSYDLTTANQGGNDEIDSDASVGNASCYNNLPYIAVTTPDNGCATHSYDVGFVGCEATVNIVVNSATDVQLSCSQPTVTLNGTGSSTGINYSYLWDGPSIVSGSTTLQPIVNQAGIYKLTVTNVAGCLAEATVIVSDIRSTPTAIITANEELTCSQTSVVLDATNSSTGTNYTYIWSGNSIVSGSTTLTPTVNAIGTYNLTVTNTTNACYAISSVTVTENTVVPTANAGSNKELTCSITSISLEGTNSSTGANYAYQWNGNSIVSGSTTLTPTVNAIGTYNLTVTNTTNACYAISSVTVTENTVVPTANAGINKELTCSITSISLDGSNSSTGANYAYQWHGNSIASGANTLNPTVDQAGIYTLTVTNITNSCYETAMVTVTDNTTPPTINAGNDEIICKGDEVVLSCIGGGTYLWSTTDISSTITVNPSNTMTYGVTVTGANGCTASDEVIVTVESCCLPPKCLPITIIKN